MTAPTPRPHPSMTPLDAAFHRVGEAQERFWLFLGAVLLAILTVASMALVVAHYGLVARDAAPVAPAPVEAGGGDVTTLDTTLPEGRVVRTGPNAYTVFLVGRMWRWSTGPIHVPQGAAITFRVTSADVVHGFAIQGTDVNLTVIPGRTGRVTTVFHEPGVRIILCNEYCGIMHHAMLTQIVVDPAPVRGSGVDARGGAK